MDTSFFEGSDRFCVVYHREKAQSVGAGDEACSGIVRSQGWAVSGKYP